MGMVVAVAVLGRNIHCVDGHCVMGEVVLGYLFTDFEGRSSLFECRIPTRGREKSKIKTKYRFTGCGLFFSLSRPFFRGGSNFSFSVAVPTPDLYKVLTE